MMKSCPPITPLPLQPAVSRPVPPAPRAKVAATSAFVARLRELGFATREDLAALVDNAPETLDTLRELAERLGSEGDVLVRLVDDVESLRLRPVPVQPDWSEGDPESGAFIRNRPDLKPVATSGSYGDLTQRPDLKPVATSGSYGDLTGKPATFPPSSHTHAQSEVTGLPAALGGKLSKAEAEAGFTEWTYSSGSYLMHFEENSYDPESEGWYLRHLNGEDVTGGFVNGAIDDVRVEFLNTIEGDIIATRTRLPTMADIPTKTSGLVNDGSDGAHPFISQDEVQHQQLTPVYGGNGERYVWMWSYSGLPNGIIGSPQPSFDTNSKIWQANFRIGGNDFSAESSWNEDGDWTNIPMAASSTSPDEESGQYIEFSYTATRTLTENPIIGYTLGGQTTKPLQPQGDYYKKPSGGIPATDLASSVQTSLGKADTAVQPAGIAGLMPMYALGATPTIEGQWRFTGDVESDTSKYSVVFDDDFESWELYYDGSVIATNSGVSTDTSITFTNAGPNDQDILAVLTTTLTVSPYTSATHTATSTAAAFEIAVGALPTGVTGKARDCILVIDCTASAVAPTVTWGTHFHPRTDTATDLAIVEAGKRAVFYISEYVAGEFAVGGWQETAGGSGT